MSDLIYLNVGGTKYTTTRNTLTKYPQSLLGRMFDKECPFKLTFDKENNVFLDRDGEMFKYILRYLRDNRLPPSKKMSYFETEAEYFCLPIDKMSANNENDGKLKEEVANNYIYNTDDRNLEYAIKEAIMNIEYNLKKGLPTTIFRYKLDREEKQVVLCLSKYGYNIMFNENGEPYVPPNY